MAGILRKLQSSELTSYEEGVSEEIDVFPVTHSKGVFHQLDEHYITDNINDLNQISLEEIVNRTGFLNSNAWTDGRTMMNFQMAISAVPPEFRKPGFVITYQNPSQAPDDVDMNGWNMLQFVGNSVTDWMVPTLWKPLKAECNCGGTSGGSDITIGNLEPGESDIPTVPPTVPFEEGRVYIGVDGSNLYLYEYINNKCEYKTVLTAPAGP